MGDSLKCSAAPIPELGQFLHERGDIKITVSSAGDSLLAFAIAQNPYPYFFSLDAKQVTAPSIDDTIRDQFSNVPITAIDISPCGCYVITGHENGQIILWSAKLRIRIAHFSISDHYPITNVSIQNDRSSMFVSLSNSQLHILSLRSIMNYLTIKSESFLQFEPKILSIRSASSCDSSVRIAAVAFDTKVVVINPSSTNDPFLEFPTKSPSIALSSHGWRFFLAIASESLVQVFEINDSRQSRLLSEKKFSSPIISLRFLTSKLLCAVFDKVICFFHVDGTDSLSVDNPDPTVKSVCSTDRNLIFPPSFLLLIETWKERSSRLIAKKSYKEALSLLCSVFTGDSMDFGLEPDRSTLTEAIHSTILLYLKEGSVDQQQLLFIADCSVKTDSVNFLLQRGFSEINDVQIQRALLVALLRATSFRSDLATPIVRKAIELEGVDQKTLEDFLLTVSLPPSFTQEAVQIARNRHFTRFLLHHFHSVYDSVFPVFAKIVESGEKEEVASAMKYVFLSKEIDKDEGNVCAVWLFSPNKLRLQNAVACDWGTAASCVSEIISRAPIKFSSNQSLKKREIIASSLAVFIDAPIGAADSFFRILVSNLSDLQITIPSEVVNTLLTFIFESSIERCLRETLLLRLVNEDFKGELKLEEFGAMCVSAGFGKAALQLFSQSGDVESVVTAMLLGDTPLDAFTFIESCDSAKARPAFIARFIGLLYLDPKRFMNILMSKFKDLHPTFVRTQSDPTVTMAYHECLFEEGLGDETDAEFYLDFLSKNNRKRFLEFLGLTHKVDTNRKLLFCQERKIQIGCSLIFAEQKKWNEAFLAYSSHLDEGGLADPDISMALLDHIKEITQPPSQALRAIIKPLVEISSERNAELVKSMVEKACQTIGKSDVLLACLPLIGDSADEKSKAKSFLIRFAKGFGCFHKLDAKSDAKLLSAIERVSAKCRGKSLSDGKLAAADGNDGVVLLTTIGAGQASTMDLETAADVKTAFQGAEKIFAEEGKRVPQNEEATIVLVIPNQH